MPSQAFDRLYRKTVVSQGPVCVLAAALADDLGFDSVVDLVHCAGQLYAAGESFRAALDMCRRRVLGNTNFRRQLEGKPPIRPEHRQLLLVLLKKKDPEPW
jgi:hypothetical protein